MHQRHVEVVAEGLLHLLPLVHAQHAVIHEHAGEVVADGAVHQQGRHGAIHAARQPADGPAVAHLLADAPHLVVDDVGGGPRGRQVAGVEQECLQQVRAEGRVHHLGVELHGEAPAGPVLHRGDGRTLRLGRDGEALGRSGDRVAMAHPARLGGEVPEQALARQHADVGAAELAGAVVGDHAAQRLRHRLHAVADAQNGNPQLQQAAIQRGRALLVHRCRPAREDDAAGGDARDLGRVDVVRHDGREHPALAHAACDQLAVLGAEVDDQDAPCGLVLELGGEVERPHVSPCRPTAPAGASCPRSSAQGRS